MRELIEALIMLELQKGLAQSQASEQNRILDTIFNGTQKAAQIVRNIKNISSGEAPVAVPELYKEPPILETEEMKVKAPAPFAEFEPELTLKTKLEEAMEALAALRVSLAAQKRNLGVSGALPRAEITAHEAELYRINIMLYDYYIR